MWRAQKKEVSDTYDFSFYFLIRCNISGALLPLDENENPCTEKNGPFASYRPFRFQFQGDPEYLQCKSLSFPFLFLNFLFLMK